MDKFELSMDTNSVHHWYFEHAARELIQNLLDNPQGFEYDYEPVDQVLELTNPNTQLERKVFLHGYSQKQGDSSSRGKYGDGLKSAVCVLLREGYEVEIFNGDVHWALSVEHSATFNSDVVVVTESPWEDNSDLRIVIHKVTQDDWDEVVANTIPFQCDIGEHHETPQGTILLEQEFKGKVFCGGLFVDYFDSEYGFDFNADQFELDRDRKALKPFDVQYKCKDMWSHVSRDADEDVAEQLVAAMDSGDKSLTFADSASLPRTCNDTVVNASEKLYNEKYSDTLVSSDYTEVEELRKAGNEVSYVENSGLVKIIQQTDSYQSFSLKAKEVKTVEEMLAEWLDKWQDEIPIEAYDDFVEMQNGINDKPTSFF